VRDNLKAYLYGAVGNRVISVLRRQLVERRWLASKAEVTLHVANMTIVEALTRVLDGTGLEAFVSLRGDVVLVRSMPAIPVQSGTIVGRVTDAKTDAVLVGATVIVEGTSLRATRCVFGVAGCWCDVSRCAGPALSAYGDLPCIGHRPRSAPPGPPIYAWSEADVAPKDPGEMALIGEPRCQRYPRQ
jgi:hypothetical protein